MYRALNKKMLRTYTKIKQRRLRDTTNLFVSNKKGSILLLQYWRNGKFDSTKIIMHFWCTNIIFADCREDHTEQCKKRNI